MNVLLEVRSFPSEVVHHACDLLLLGVDPGRQEPAEAQRGPLLEGEGRSLVQAGAVEQDRVLVLWSAISRRSGLWSSLM